MNRLLSGVVRAGVAACLATAAHAQPQPSAIGALAPGFCEARDRAPAPDPAPRGYELLHVYAACEQLSALNAGRRDALDTYGYVYVPRLASPWEQPSPPAGDDAKGDGGANEAGRRDEAYASLGGGGVAGEDGARDWARNGADQAEASDIRVLGAGRWRDEPGATVRRPASFRVDRTAAATLDALARSIEPGGRAEIGRWIEGEDMRLTAEFRRPAADAGKADAGAELRLTAEIRWPGDEGGVTRILALPYRNADTLRYMRAQLRASAAADRIARLRQKR